MLTKVSTRDHFTYVFNIYQTHRTTQLNSTLINEYRRKVPLYLYLW